MIPRRDVRDIVGLNVAREWARLGTCGRRKVGCMLASADGNPLSIGYNGPASGEPHCLDTGAPNDRACAGRDAPSGTDLDACEAIHAEMNAIARCRDVKLIHTCYVTSSPCITCVKMLMGTGCQRIVFVDEYPHKESRDKWLKSGSKVVREWIQIQPAELVKTFHVLTGRNIITDMVSGTRLNS